MSISPEIITQFGLMNKISTGNSAVDMLLCLMVPVLIRNVLPKLTKLIQRLRDRIFGRSITTSTLFTRTIKNDEGSSSSWWSRWDSSATPSNAILQRAILNFINLQVQTLRALPGADLQLKRRPRNKVVLATSTTTDGGGGDSGSDDDDTSNDAPSNPHDYTFNVAPPLSTWVTLPNGVEFMRSSSAADCKDQQQEGKSAVITFTLRSFSADGNTKIEEFVTEALDCYRKQQTAKVDVSRYLYVPVLSGFRAFESEQKDGDGNKKAPPAAIYKRYQLSDDKSFASFFHPEKAAILHLLNQFLSKKGKFSIPGYPQKLGFLLYGPPGTGKTSFIKALAQHTKRSIISIPLAKITTNQELMDIVFDNRIAVQNASGSSVQLPYSKTIFVMEDVDAASNVVRRRTPANPNTPAHATAAARLVALAEQVADAKEGPAGGSKDKRASRSHLPTKNSIERNDGTNQDQDEEEGGPDGTPVPAAAGTGTGGDDTSSCKDGGVAATTGSSEIVPAAVGYADGCGGADSSTPVGPYKSPLGFGNTSLWKVEDELNLAGLLNVLDGVVDTPGRIVIMTTNCPEKLDPALIRPGRINKKIYMGRCLVGEALAMLRHYFGGTVPAEDEAALRRVFVDGQLSPAALEAMCAEYDSVSELVKALADKFDRGPSADDAFKPCGEL